MYDYVVHFDGGCWPNPGGDATWGYVIEGKHGEVLFSEHGAIAPGDTSNNVAECMAAAHALATILEKCSCGDSVLFVGDSQIAIRKLGTDKPGKGLFSDVCKVMQDFYKAIQRAGVVIEPKWVPREENEMADALTRMV